MTETPTGFHLILGADCEATQHAINDPALGQRAVQGLRDVAERESLKLTLFVIPTDLEASPTLYRDLSAAGHEISLHLHPADLGGREFFGVYGPDDQRRILATAIDRFAQVMGEPPAGLCIGYVSANDHTYGVAAELGFRHGMLSMPTRILPECASVWAGAPLGVHYAHPYNRLLPGFLDLVNVPATVDPDSRMWGGKHPQDLRVELVDAKNHWYTIAKAVDRQRRNDDPVKVIQITTHNIFDYSDKNNFRRETLEKMIAHARRIVADRQGAPTAATMADVAETYRQRFPLPKPDDFTLTLDTSGRS